MVALSVPMLGEQVGWRRWSAVAVGFVGVMIMLDPWGISFHAMSLIVLARHLLLLAVDRHGAADQPLRPRRRHALLVRPVSPASSRWSAPSRSGSGRPPIDWVWLIVLGLLGGVAPDPGHPGLATGAGGGPGPLRLRLDRAGRAVRLPLVPGGAVLDGLARPAAGHRLGPLYPPSRADSGPRARHGRPAVTAREFCRIQGLTTSIDEPAFQSTSCRHERHHLFRDRERRQADRLPGLQGSQARHDAGGGAGRRLLGLPVQLLLRGRSATTTTS